MFVVTVRCNQKCTYCHASSQDETSGISNDMDSKTARKRVEMVFKSPSSNIKIEFQGGEPLLNFEIIKEVVEYAVELNNDFQKIIEFVICTNLVNLNSTHVEFIKKHNIIISTSLDGSRNIHNKCRKLRNGKGSYDYVVSNLEWLKSELDYGRVNALMTVTPHNVFCINEVIDEYISKDLFRLYFY